MKIVSPGRAGALFSFFLWILAGCSGSMDRTEVEIIRAFETGALTLNIVIEEGFDGYSNLYRISTVAGDRSAPLLAGAGRVQESLFEPSALEIVEFEWTLDGEDAGSGSTLDIAFSEAAAHTVGVRARLDGRIVASYRSSFDGLPIGEFAAGETIHLTLSDTGVRFAVPGTVTGIRGEESGVSDMVVVGETTSASVIEAGAPGFYLVSSALDGASHTTNVFVSPVPTKHVDRVDHDWYYTQFRTQTTSNCGPSVVSMGIAWATGHEVPVSTVRSIIGWTGTGAVSMPELKTVLDQHQVSSQLHWLESPELIFDILDEGHLIGVVYDMAGISFTENAADNLFGQYYVDAGGHYLMIKGYSLDREYFVVYDPIPSDWVSNSKRYGDGMSMFGRNRYYDVDELFAALRSRQIIEIGR